MPLLYRRNLTWAEAAYFAASKNNHVNFLMRLFSACLQPGYATCITRVLRQLPTVVESSLFLPWMNQIPAFHK